MSRHAQDRRRSRRPEVGNGFIDKLFLVIASPFFCAAGLALLSGLHFAEAARFLENSTVAWTVVSVRAVGGAIVAISGLAMFVARLLPSLKGARLGNEDAINPDLSIEAGQDGFRAVERAVGLSRRRSAAFSGSAASAGALTLFVALLGFVLAPIWQEEGLPRGGKLQLSTAKDAESALVLREGLKVQENLGGWRFELKDLDLGRLQAGKADADGHTTATIQATQIPTGAQVQGTVDRAQPIVFGPFTLRLGAVEPTPRPVGVEVEVKDTETGAVFPLSLIAGRAVGGPDGASVFSIDRIDPDFMDGQGLAAHGAVTPSKGAESQEFWVFEGAAGFDRLHRKGRFEITYKRTIPGHQVTLLISQPATFDPVAIFIGLLALGVFLLFFAAQTASVRVTRRGQEALLLSSINDGEGLAMMVARVVAGREPDEAYDEPSGEEEEAGGGYDEPYGDEPDDLADEEDAEGEDPGDAAEDEGDLEPEAGDEDEAGRAEVDEDDDAEALGDEGAVEDNDGAEAIGDEGAPLSGNEEGSR